MHWSQVLPCHCGGIVLTLSDDVLGSLARHTCLVFRLYLLMIYQGSELNISAFWLLTTAGVKDLVNLIIYNQLFQLI